MILRGSRLLYQRVIANHADDNNNNNSHDKTDIHIYVYIHRKHYGKTNNDTHTIIYYNILP